jgi:hypothetical protein
MRPLSTAELLEVWEQGLLRNPVQRSLLLLIAAWPELAPQQLAQLSIGRRDAHLLTLREWTFGTRLVSFVACPECEERLEFTIQASELRVAAISDSTGDLSINVAGYQIAYRLPDSLDLLALANSPPLSQTYHQLLARCILRADYEGESQPVEQLPTQVTETVEAEMARLDPQADVHLGLTCPGCQHSWAAPFDIGSFFWQEINGWAYRILREVHLLASAYGWREADILAMSAGKRQLYLQMIHG